MGTKRKSMIPVIPNELAIARLRRRHRKADEELKEIGTPCCPAQDSKAKRLKEIKCFAKRQLQKLEKD